MLTDLAYCFLDASRHLVSNVKYVLGQVLEKYEKKVKEKKKVIDGILKAVRRRLQMTARKRLRVHGQAHVG